MARKIDYKKTYQDRPARVQVIFKFCNFDFISFLARFHTMTLFEWMKTVPLMFGIANGVWMEVNSTKSTSHTSLFILFSFSGKRLPSIGAMWNEMQEELGLILNNRFVFILLMEDVLEVIIAPYVVHLL